MQEWNQFKDPSGGKSECIAARNILVLNSCPEILCLLSTLVGRVGYTPIEAMSNEEALVMLSHPEAISSLHLAILEIAVGGGFSYDVYRAIRKQRSDLPVLFISGRHYTDELIGILAEDDAASFMAKPFSITMMRRVIENPRMWNFDVLQAMAVQTSSL